MSSTGLAPKCANCFSLERHRSYREIFLQLRRLNLLGKNVLQFSPDRSTDPSWFENFEVSVYGGENTLDIQRISRDSGQYDLVIANHVLEHVPYDNSALNELLRITRIDGFVFFAVPAPLQNESTNDWGYAKEEDHGHYRIYGNDINERLKFFIPQAHIFYLDQNDPVTGMPERVFIASRSRKYRDTLERAGVPLTVVHDATLSVRRRLPLSLSVA